MTLFDYDITSADNEDPELEKVHRHLLQLDPDGAVFGRVLRETIDQLLDGEHTGRFDWRDLHKTEKTHAGTLVEINLQREFKFASHAEDSTIHMDYLIEGVEVDCKFSQKRYGWMIPPEALGEVCLVVWADDHQSLWGAGLLRADRSALTMSEGMTKKGNRDGKFRLTREHHGLVRWLWHDKPLRENLLLHLPADVRASILNPPGGRVDSGQARVNALFSRIHNVAIDREVIRTLGKQRDYMARVREDKSSKNRARTKLRPDGIIILGQSRLHQKIAEELGGEVPRNGEFVAHRVRRAQPGDDSSRVAEIEGELWTIASPSDPWETAPKLPTKEQAPTPHLTNYDLI
ncbi:NaeI family type II restriction endonuclease [Streptomyces mangrovisoli]|uniref:Restriction endonuclease n=1 Tax=Streptomyces mangrovisoli TaxID=1428628 RepID=A0A1J4NSC0_9ACTN|nr:NaeI family type II restriction endonuclease [Streptomyces mangrovisoli]OIJ65227.1 restriction endonuclease [Streptomyces mangrovisoli]